TVVTATDCKLLCIEGPALRTLIEESNVVARNLLRMFARRLRHDNLLVSRTLEEQDELQSRAHRDALTGLYNRRWFDNALAVLMDHHRARGGRLSLLMIDIDRFKRVNDTHGHPTGDRAICAIAEVLRAETRAADHAARVGGEEFAVLLPHTGGEEAAHIAERIRHAVRQRPIAAPDGVMLPPVTVSIGIAEASPEETEQNLLARADAALYKAKRAGRDRVMC
ncbi:MAG TPA: diguanylate cyclase, partial [Alphaproteobacteria bacterium]|nr:diguanylate cyclase [Alphaproteobacteria bacterium]